MDRNEAQGRIILARGLASQEQVHRAWQAASACAGGDLCSALQSWGVLDPTRAAEVRAEAQAAPAVIGGHRVLGELSRGGMGVVFRAEHRSLKVPMALKLLLAENANDRQRARFEREARALLALNHPNAVRLLDYGEDRGRPFLAMELIAGRSLQDEVKEAFRAGRPPPLGRVLAVIAPVAEALAAGHRAGLIHRDLKPSNIMIEAETDRPVLIDYGLAGGEIVRGDAPSLTGSQDVMGTPSYMAPEQFDAREFGKVGPPADVWGLGGVLFFCLTGRAPFEGAPLGIYNKILAGERPALGDLARAPAWLEELCARCFALEPEERIALDALLSELRRSRKAARPGGKGAVRRRRESGRRALAFAALILAAAASGLGALALRPAPVWLAEPRLPEWTAEPFIEVSARLDRPGRVRVEREEGGAWTLLAALEAGADGGLAGRAPGLREGENRLRFIIEDGERVVERRVGLDSAPPKLILRDAWRGALPYDGGRLTLRGRIEDGGPCRLEVAGKALAEPRAGDFALSLDPGGGPSLSVAVIDRAGRRVARTLSLVSRARFEVCRALQERTFWRAASAELQRRACLEVAASLGSDFEFAGLEEYACGGQRHRIGRIRYRLTGSLLHLIPGGRFVMGCASPEADFAYAGPLQAAERRLAAAASPAVEVPAVTRGAYAREAPAHEVRVAAFLIGQTEISFGEWERGGGEAPAGLRRQPVVRLTWQEARAGLADYGFRLPSEAEWEYACRAGTTTRYYFGDAYDERYVYSWRRGLRPRPVGGGRGAANAFGLEDMCGNVAEMCEDVASGGYAGAPADGSARRAPVHPEDLRVVRGGDVIRGGAHFARSSWRGQIGGEERSLTVGFRVARSLPGFSLEGDR